MFAGFSFASAGPIQHVNSLPTVFVENKGQWDSQAKFLVQGKGVDLWITSKGPVYDFSSSAANGRVKRQIVRMSLVGAKLSSVTGHEQLNGRFNYISGNDRSKWVTGVRRFREVQTYDGCDGVSVRYYIENGSPRYDLIVQPGVDLSQVAMKIDGADGVAVLPNGNLQISTIAGTVEERGLTAYQEADGVRTEVACRMVNEGDLVSFDMGAYDPSKPLVIDPLVFSTYVGNPSGFVASVSSDAQGNIYGVGTSLDPSFPNITGISSTGLPSTAFIFKMNPTGTDLIYGTYIGAGVSTSGEPAVSPGLIAVGVDASGNAYATGIHAGSGLPAIGPTPTDPESSVGNVLEEAFLIKLNPSGTSLLYSQLLGLYPSGLAVDSSGDCYLHGYPFGCPATSGAYQTTPPPNSNYMSIVAKLDPTGSTLLYSTYLPEDAPEGGVLSFDLALGGANTAPLAYWGNDHNIAIDANGEVALYGIALSGFPTTPGAILPNVDNVGEVLVKLNSKGSDLVYATYVVQYPGPEEAANAMPMALAEDSTGNVVIAGSPEQTFTDSEGTGYSMINGILKLDSNGNQVFNGFYDMAPMLNAIEITSNPFLAITDIAFDSQDNIIVAGGAVPGMVTTPDAFQGTFTPRQGLFYTSAIRKYDPTGTTLLYSSYFGAPEGENCWPLFLNVRADGVAVICGLSQDSDFPTTPGAYQTTPGDAYVAAFSMPGLPAGMQLGTGEVESGNSIQGSVSTKGIGSQPLVYALKSSSPYAVVPPSVTIPAGLASATFKVTTTPVTTSTTATITASHATTTYKSTLILSAAKLVAFYAVPASVFGGAESDVVVRMGSPAPSNGLTVALSSNVALGIPKEITIPSGQTAVSFHVSSQGVSTETTATLKASYGSASLETQIVVKPAILKRFTANPTAVVGGQAVRLNFGLEGLAGPSGDTINLSGGSAVSLPASVKIAVNENSADLTVVTKPVSAAETVKITATLASADLVGSFTIEPATLSQLELVPGTVLGGTNTDAVLRMSGATGGSGAVVTLSSFGSVTVPASVKVAAGTSAVSFPVPTKAVDSEAFASVTARLGAASQTATIIIEPAVLTGLSLGAQTVAGGKGTTATVHLNGPTGPSGDEVRVSTTGPVTAPSYVIVPPGSSGFTFQIGTSKVGTTTAAHITVSYNSATFSQALTVTP